MRPLYQHESSLQSKPPQTSHLGLWFERFFDKFEPDWSVKPDSKKAWIQTVCGEHGDTDLMAQHAQRRQQLAGALGGVYREFKTQGAFVTGLGISHPVENGITWHRTLGLPYLPGSGVKGLLRAWVEQWMTFADEEQRLQTVHRWFGRTATQSDTETDTDTDNSAGELVFFDLLPCSKLTLGCEVMTPHMGKWYENGANIRSTSDFATSAPADWHSPVPVMFLTVQNGQFATLITARVPAAQAEVERALNELSQALEWLGAGAKTATGFGRMQELQAVKRRQEEAAQQRLMANTEEWISARITYNRGAKSLCAEKNAKQASASSETSAALLAALPPAVRAKIERGEYLKLTVRVSGGTLLELLT